MESSKSREPWVVLVSNGQETTTVYGPFDRARAEQIAEDNNTFVQTRGFAEIKQITPTPKGPA